MHSLVKRYNKRKENDLVRSEVYDEMTEHLSNLILEVQKEFKSGVFLENVFRCDALRKTTFGTR